MVEFEFIRIAGIAEADVLEINASFKNGCVGIAVGDIHFLIKNFVDSDKGSLGTGKGHYKPGKHCKGAYRLGGIGNHTYKFAGKKAGVFKDDLFG